MHTLIHHYFKDKHACLGPQRREGIPSGNSFTHWDRWLLRYWLQCSYHKNLLGRKVGETFSSAVLPALHMGELVTVTSFFRLWLLLGKKWNRGQDNLNSPCHWRAGWLQVLSSGGEKSLADICNYSQAETGNSAVFGDLPRSTTELRRRNQSEDKEKILLKQ